MDSIEQLNNKFIEEAKKIELKEYCERQYKEIIRILSINKKLEEEVAHLKTLLVNGTSIIQAPQIITNEELVCIKQIQELKYISDSQTLTLEEVRKFSELVKVLGLIRNKKSSELDIFKDIQTQDLLRIIEENEQPK